MDYKQYRLNLTKWNQNTTGDIEWDLAYSLLEVILISIEKYIHNIGI